MLLNTIEFMLLFPTITSLYWISPPTARKWILLLISYFMYAIATSAFATCTILFVTCITYAIPLLADKYKYNAKTLTQIGCIASITPLLTLKYTPFALNSIESIFHTVGVPYIFPKWDILMPLGISFFTFQALSYTLDVAQGKRNLERNFFDYALFVSFFPQIACGPISKSSELIPQIKAPRPICTHHISSGAKKILYGLFLKFVIADRCAIYVDSIYNNYSENSGLTCFIASLFYSIQIYADFSGYSLLAIGVANTLGFDIIENFKRPYLSISVSDFWRRWHISLSRWLRDYIFIPMGGSRQSKFRTYLNITATFLVSGLWHGANWTFVFWGGIHGALQCIEKFAGINSTQANGVTKAFRIILTFLLINFTWIFFRMSNISDAFGFINNIFTNPFTGKLNIPNETTTIICLLIGASCIVAKDFRDEFIPGKFRLFENDNIIIRFGSYLATIFAILTLGVLDGGQFIYANF